MQPQGNISSNMQYLSCFQSQKWYSCNIIKLILFKLNQLSTVYGFILAPRPNYRIIYVNHAWLNTAAVHQKGKIHSNVFPWDNIYELEFCLINLMSERLKGGWCDYSHYNFKGVYSWCTEIAIVYRCHCPLLDQIKTAQLFISWGW